VCKRKATDVDDEFDPRVPLALERVLVELDYCVLLSLLKDNPDKLRTGLEELEKAILEQGAANDHPASATKTEAACASTHRASG